MKFSMIDAILSLVPQASFSCYGTNYSGLNWTDDRGKPTEAEIEAEVNRLENEFSALEYSRNRANEFPSIPDQLDEIYHNGIDSWKAVIKVTKDKYPKG